MANTFKNAIQPDLGTSVSLIYAAPAGNAAILTELDVANKTAGAISVDVFIWDSSAGANAYIIKDALVPTKNALQVVVGQKLVLEANDRVYALANVANSASVIASVLEGV